MGNGAQGGFGGFEDILNEMFGGSKRQSSEGMNQTSVMNLNIDFTESVNGATKVLTFLTLVCLIRSDGQVRNMQRQQVQTRNKPCKVQLVQWHRRPNYATRAFCHADHLQLV